MNAESQTETSMSTVNYNEHMRPTQRDTPKTRARKPRTSIFAQTCVIGAALTAALMYGIPSWAMATAGLCLMTGPLAWCSWAARQKHREADRAGVSSG